MKSSRRNFISDVAMATGGFACQFNTAPAKNPFTLVPNKQSPPGESARINIFSKYTQELGYDELASLVAEMGFDGIDLTVRRGGHVLPENVERDLPIAVKAAKRQGLNISMITTDILNANDPFIKPILKTAASFGIQSYRMGRGFYDEKKSIPDNLENFKMLFEKLVKLNGQFHIRGEYQNHAGAGFGAPVWDIWEVIKNNDPQWIGVQYDLFHATVEGANSWPIGFNLLEAFIGTLNIKDFYWQKQNGAWGQKLTPLGEGLVDFKKLILLLKENKIKRSFSVHCEYLSDKASTAQKKAKMRQDLLTLRGWLKEAGL